VSHWRPAILKILSAWLAKDRSLTNGFKSIIVASQWVLWSLWAPKLLSQETSHICHIPSALTFVSLWHGRGAERKVESE
jgi:hypothetical protein